MSMTLTPEIERLVREQMARGDYASELDLLREALRLVAERRDMVEAIREGLADVDAGRTRPMREVDADLRARFLIGSMAEFSDDLDAAVKAAMSDRERLPFRAGDDGRDSP